MIELAAVAGWIAAGLSFGLWLGERGRRLDAQRREGILVAPSRSDSKAFDPMTGKELPPDDSAEAVFRNDAVRQKMIDDAIAEGLSETQAAADVDSILAEIRTLGA